MKHVAIVTVSFNSDKETHDLLTSLSKVKCREIELKIIVIDNGSQVPFILSEKEKQLEIELICYKDNTGFTGGYNKGIQRALAAKADYVILLNNDTTVDPSFAQELVGTFEIYPECGIAVPKIYFAKNHEFHKEKYKESEKGKVLWYAGGFMDWRNVFSRHRGVDEVDHGQYQGIEKVDFATGCCMCIPRSVFEKVGMLDNELFLFFEDADFSQRVLRAGFNIIYNPKSVIWHVNAASGGGSGSVLNDYYLTRNRMIFGMRYAPLWTKFALFRESIMLLMSGRKWQRVGIRDYYLRRFGKGSFSI